MTPPTVLELMNPKQMIETIRKHMRLERTYRTWSWSALPHKRRRNLERKPHINEAVVIQMTSKDIYEQEEWDKLSPEENVYSFI